MAIIDKLSAIGTAIREKTGKSDLMTLDAMPDEIRGISGGGAEVEPIVLTGNCQYACSGAVANKYIELFGNTISTNGITDASNMFSKFKGESIPFDINLTGTAIPINNMLHSCSELKLLPKINNQGKVNNLTYLFANCYSLREIPEDYFDDWDWSNFTSTTNNYIGNASYLFYSCYSLRKLPLEWLKNMNPYAAYSYTYFFNGFLYCYALDELVNLPLPYTAATWTTSVFNSTFSNCYRLKNIIFETNEDGTPKVMKWKSQTIDLNSNKVGYVNGLLSDILDYNSGITADKEVIDDATYQALKNDPDWFTRDINYSRYNHDSAVATINSLPDTSAYLASAGGTNTIKFKGAAGALTDGGAINTLTEEEIAVAAAKGWTVSFA